MQDKVEVNEADRIAFEAIPRAYRSSMGGNAREAVLAALARHREQATASLREERDALREALLAVKERGLPDRYHSDAILARQVDDALSSALGEG